MNNSIASNTDIGKRIEKLRKSKGLTQETLGDMLGVKRETISQWEKGTRDIKTGHIIALSQRLDTTADYILCISENSTNDTTLQRVSAYLGVNDKTVIGIKNNIAMLTSNIEEHNHLGNDESELLDIFEKIVTFDDSLLDYIVRNILAIVENNDLNFYVNTVAFNSYEYAKFEQTSVKSEKDITEFLIYKTFTDYFMQIAKDYGSSFSDDDIQRINSAKDYKELLKQMMTYKSDRLNSLLWRKYANRFINLLKEEGDDNG